MAKFEKGNPGKPKGALTKTNKLIKEIFADVFYSLQDDPKASLEAWAKENPGDFYKLGIRLVPTQVNVSANISLQDEPIIIE
ncbi:MAG: hypothetical protein JWR05_3497 [Mucilaginibacter sp.]|nr:hypothetical protein [Mucilaginibacter sp.]